MFEIDKEQLALGPRRATRLSSLVSAGLTYLVFRAQNLRLLLGLAVAVVLFVVSTPLLPAPTSEVYRFLPLVVWLTICFTVAVIDQRLISKPALIYRNCVALGLQGRYLEALSLLDKISPRNGCLNVAPRELYHLQRAILFTHAGRYDHAEAESFLAHEFGLSTEHFTLLRAEIFIALEDFAQAREELRLGKELLGETPNLVLTQALIEVVERKNWPAAKALLTKAQAIKGACRHPSGENTTFIAHVFYQIALLWTGRAEDGLAGLSRSLPRLRSQARQIESLRSLLSWVYLERSYYLATHQEPHKALEDLTLAEGLCAYAMHHRRSRLIREELSARHGLT